MISEYRLRYNTVFRDLLSTRTRLRTYRWGVLAVNPENPDHYDANTTIWELVEDPEGALDQVEKAYGQYGITPRICLTEYSTPETLSAFLSSRGYQATSADEETTRLMLWKHAAVDAPSRPPGSIIRRATEADLDAMARIQYEEDNLVGPWATRYLGYGLADPRVAYWLAELGGEPAAVVALGQGEEMGLIDDVATLPAHRGRGLAAALIRQAQHYATTDLMLTVVADNAQRIYERAGFEVVDTISEIRWTPRT